MPRAARYPKFDFVTQKWVWARGEAYPKATPRSITLAVEALLDPAPIRTRGKPSKNARRRRRLWVSGVRTCFRCGKAFASFEATTLEHIIPQAEGGTSQWENLSLSHRRCNNEYRSRSSGGRAAPS